MEKIEIAKVLRPHGLSGELKCKLYNPNLEFYNDLKEVYLEGKDIPSRVVSVRVLNDYIYLKLGTIDSREKADLLRGFGIYIDKSKMQIASDEYIIADLIGIDVIDENGEVIGKLVDVENYGASDILVITQYKRNYSVPFTQSIVKSVDILNKKMVIYRKNYDEAKICE